MVTTRHNHNLFCSGCMTCRKTFISIIARVPLHGTVQLARIIERQRRMDMIVQWLATMIERRY
jgi:hypothetical protein